MKGLKLTIAGWVMLALMILIAVVTVMTALGPAPAVAQDNWANEPHWSVVDLAVRNSATIDNDLTVTDDLAVTDDASVGGMFTLATGPTVLTSAAATLTSPTVTFSAANRTLVTLTSDANLTGCYPTGGTLGQVLVIKTGTGSNTMRFDDGTSMTVGSNRTITEGQIDILTLLCVSSDGDEWALQAFGDN